MLRARTLPALFVTLALGALVGATHELHAQETIASDRPGIGSGSTVVDKGVAQLEAGAAYAGATGPGTVQIGQALARVGLSGFELELFGNSFVVRRANDFVAGRSGFEDFGVGVKVPVIRGESGALSLQGISTVPTGADFLTSDEWVVTVNALADFTLSDRVGLNANLGVSEGTGAIPTQIAVTVTPSLALADDVSAYAGWAGFYSKGPDLDWAEAGLAWIANPDLQFDLNWGWAPDADAWFLGAGVAVRRGAR